MNTGAESDRCILKSGSANYDLCGFGEVCFNSERLNFPISKMEVIAVPNRKNCKDEVWDHIYTHIAIRILLRIQ